MKLIFSLLLGLSIFGLTCAAQSVCPTVTPSESPALFNLKLGMTPAEARSVLGKSLKIKNKRGGEYTFFENFIEKPAPVSLTGVRALYLRFFKGSLYQIEIFYEGETGGAQTLESFINLQAAKLNLPPPELWKIKYGIAEINCGAFSVEADNFLNPRLQLSDETTLKEVAEKRKKD
ncbi:MAG: hypothetical protein M3384_11855 [Acidobacteriota bacterium]|nr:hypothetical protein [Acidobacteriota bacterium]